MKIFFPLLLVIIIAGCASKKSFEDIYLNGDKYCLKETESLFTGELILRFESGIVSNRIRAIEGIPNGDWVSYGYKNEIIQRGNYKPLMIDGDNPLSEIELLRLNVCTVKEGEDEFTDVLLVLKKENYSVPIDLKDRIDAFLKSKSINIKGDSINDIKFVKAELE